MRALRYVPGFLKVTVSCTWVEVARGGWETKARLRGTNIRLSSSGRDEDPGAVLPLAAPSAGNISTNFSMAPNSVIRTTKLGNSALTPPGFLINFAECFTFRPTFDTGEQNEQDGYVLASASPIPRSR